ncbi:MAG: phenylalanine--tRNA ligase subunit beta, partial [Anaerolineales bacterium]|nr:phenylalanine--tRNA ligase subunit beta [Anaerolineales bacterium]MDW8226975.1 phenylalanine--tRNA ligase subunit beta [Anaerolineales bacterium]
VKIGPSPEWVQRRLKLAGMRPINNIVDATNYVMLEIGEPLHAFDYDVLVERVAGSCGGGLSGKPKIITRTASPGEKLTTLDGVERTFDETTVLVCDTAGPLSIAGVMGGLESEVSEKTRNVLLEGAAWNFINIRKTARAQQLTSEASYRFSRGVHPAMAERGVRRGLELMQAWAGGTIEPTLVDNYPLPPKTPTIQLSTADVRRWLGIELSREQIKGMLERLEFTCLPQGEDGLLVTAPDHRLDIGEGITGKADLIEEIARIYGYDNLPETRMSDLLPPQLGNPTLEKEERVRDLLVNLGLNEIISYRWTTPEREGRRFPAGASTDDRPYLRIANPLAYEKAFLRQSVLASVLDTAERNARFRQRLALFEIGPQFLPADDPSGLPIEQPRLAILLAGSRSLPGWQPADSAPMDFYDLKGLLMTLFEALNLRDVHVEATEHPTFHPGKCARLMTGQAFLGVFGELHPEVRAQYDWPLSFRAPILAADVDLTVLLECIPPIRTTMPLPVFPPVLEDLAIVVDEAIPAGQVEALIRQAAGRIVTEVRLFDVYRGEKIGAGKKSLAYRITYQAPDKTLSDRDVAGIRARILKRLEQELGASLRK